MKCAFDLDACFLQRPLVWFMLEHSVVFAQRLNASLSDFQ